MIKIIYVDMDGVLCDFKKRFVELFKYEPEVDYPSKKKEKLEYKRRFDVFVQEDHFTDLDPMPDFDEAIAFLKSIESKYTIKILSSTAKEKYLVNVSDQKQIWLDKHDIKYPAIFVPGKKLKQYYARPDSLLIDDTLSSVVEWRDRGGPAIWHKSWVETIKEFEENYE
jgi:hypothetical protein